MNTILDIRRKFIAGEISGSEYDDAVDKLDAAKDGICIEDKIFNLVVGKLPEEALCSDMLLNVVDDSVICDWKDEDGHHYIAYKVDMIVNSHLVTSS